MGGTCCNSSNICGQAKDEIQAPEVKDLNNQYNEQDKEHIVKIQAGIRGYLVRKNNDLEVKNENKGNNDSGIFHGS